VLALGNSLREPLQWLEERFRREIGSLYPGYLLRFRPFSQPEHISVAALRGLIDPLLVHPLWLALMEHGFAPGGERGPQLDAYVILSGEDQEGLALLGPLVTNLRRACQGRLEPTLRLFYVGASPATLAEQARPLTCFVLGALKQRGYGTGGEREPWETIRLTLNALLASQAPQEIEALFPPGQDGRRVLALGASAIAIARPQMEACVRAGVLERLAQACLAAPAQPAARAPVADLFGLQLASEGPEELWAKRLGQGIASLFPAWANEVLAGWGLEVGETRQAAKYPSPPGHWRVETRAEGEVQRHLERILAGGREEQEEAQAALAQDLARLAAALQRRLHAHEKTVLDRWQELLQRTVADGEGCLARAQGMADLAMQALTVAQERVSHQRPGPLWLRQSNGHDVLILAEALAGQMSPWRAAGERARERLAPATALALRAAPWLILGGAIGADLWPGVAGWGVGLAAGISLGLLAAGVQARTYGREARSGSREATRLYENAVLGLLLGAAHDILQHWQDAVAICAAQVKALTRELRTLEATAGRMAGDLGRRAGESVYLERRLSDPIRCAHLAESIPIEQALAGAPAQALAAALTGSLPARVVGATMAGAVSARAIAPIEARVEEMLVAGGSFSPAGTMEALHRRALPLWMGETEGPEWSFAVLSREAAVAVRSWLDTHRQSVHQLPTLQRDRITYLRLRRVAAAQGPRQAVEPVAAPDLSVPGISGAPAGSGRSGYAWHDD